MPALRVKHLNVNRRHHAVPLARQFVFPSAVLRPWGDSGRMVRWHASDSTIQRAFKQALHRAGVHKHASVHTLRHSFLCHTSAGVWNRHSHNPVVARSSKPSNDDDLYACKPGHENRDKPTGRSLTELKSVCFRVGSGRSH